MDESQSDVKQSLPESSSVKESDKTPDRKALKTWWRRLSKPVQASLLTISGLLLVGVVVALTPLRFHLVGLVHKGQVSVVVVDDLTHQPIPDAQVGVGQHSDITDKSGRVKLTGLPLGRTTVTINKHAYQTKTIQTTLFWSPKNLGSVAIHSTGVLIKFSVVDWVSGKGISDAKVTIGQSTATTDSAGLASVSLEPQAVSGAKATITAPSFTDQTVAIAQAVNKTNAIILVPSGSVYFFSNRAGKIDLYSSNLDGSAQTVVLKGTGSEDASTGLLPSISDPNSMVIVSSRVGKHDSFGSLEHDLYYFNGSSKALTLIDSNIQFTDFRGWIGTTLIYVITGTDSSVTVKAYDTKAKSSRALVTLPPPANPGAYINVNGLGIAAQSFYYSIASSDPNQNGFYTVGLSGSATKLDPGSVNQAYRQAKDSLIVSLSAPASTAPAWKKLTFSSRTFTNLPGEPASQANRGYADSPDGQHSIYVETRDGKSQLYLTDGSGNNDQAITTSGSVNQFVQWFGSKYVAYTTNANQSSTIYVVSIGGGVEKKVTDFFQGNGKTYGGGYNPAYF